MARPKSDKLYLRMPDSYKVMIPTIVKLSSKGLNKGHITRELKIDVNAFHKYREVQEAFDDGRTKLAKEVAGAFTKHLKTSYSDRVHLSKSLRLFASGFTVDPIVDINSARNALAEAIKEFASGKLSIDDLESIRKASSTYSDLVVSTSIEERLQAVEEELNDGKVSKLS